ncbi:MAG: peroxiredoxin [Anaerolineae bacterium]|jgi:peroxiredoxin Q/BCP|nr:peroxiredoxin [Anaerolineae bacterium]
MLTIGQPFPDFALPNQNGDTVRLSDLRGKSVVIFAFPKAAEMSFGCNTQACEFRDEFPRIEALNATVLGISGDTPAQLKKWRVNRKLNYDLISDESHAVLEQWGAWGMNALAGIKIPMVNRSYWVINEDGILIDQQIGVGPKASVEKAIEALNKAHQTA